MKKAMIISSSPRRGGNSDTLCDRFMQGVMKAGHHAEKIFLRDHKIGYGSKEDRAHFPAHIAALPGNAAEQ